MSICDITLCTTMKLKHIHFNRYGVLSIIYVREISAIWKKCAYNLKNVN